MTSHRFSVVKELEIENLIINFIANILVRHSPMNPGNTLDTKTLFAGLAKKLNVDCIFDIGSRDGDQSLFFRDILPDAQVAAFEANPSNYKAIVAKGVPERGIQVYPYAVSNSNGMATFYVADPDSDPHAIGSSSLLPGGYLLKEKIDVETHRLDDFVLENYPAAKRLALWIDVESAEYEVLEGITKIKDRVLVIHTETAVEAVRENQKTFSELVKLMESLGFTLCGSSLRWKIGDVVFINDQARPMLGYSLGYYQFRSRITDLIRIGSIAVFFKKKSPPLYRFLRAVYLKFT
jgi:FkbM family methyltransferase